MGRAFALAVALMLGLFAMEAGADQRREIRIVDAAGREVAVRVPVRSVVLGDAWDILTLNLLLDDPIEPLVGWVARGRVDHETAAAFRSRFPRFDEVPSLGATPDSMTVEDVTKVAPDALLLGNGYAPDDPRLAAIASAGIPVIFIASPDAITGRTGPAVRDMVTLLGHLFAREGRAGELVRFHAERLGLVSERLRRQPDRPRLLLEAHAGSVHCCWSPGRQSDYVEFVGGTNIGAETIGIDGGKLSIDHVRAADPALVIGTGGVHMRRAGGVVLGPGVAPEEARSSLARAMARPVFADLSAVRAGQVHAVWHQMIGTPLEAPAFEAMARWIHPTLFGDLDPERTLSELNDRFAAVPMVGTMFVAAGRD